MSQFYVVLVILAFLITSASLGTCIQLTRSNEFLTDVKFAVKNHDVPNTPQIPVGILQQAGRFGVTPPVALSKKLTSEQRRLLISQINSTVEMDFGMIAENTDFKLRQFAAENGSSLCLKNTLQFLDDLKLNKMYAVQMSNSMGKSVTVTDAILTYVLTSLGKVEQCQAVQDWNPDSPYETTYCTMAYPVPSSYAVVGLCVPATCNATELKEIVTKFKPDLGKYVIFDCLVPYPWKPWAIVTLCILGFFVLLLFVGTLYHTMVRPTIQRRVKVILATMSIGRGNNTNENQESEQETHYGSNKPTQPLISNRDIKTNDGYANIECGETSNQDGVEQTDKNMKELERLGTLDTIMLGFSPIHNASKILSTEQTAGNLAILNGIRVISMWWIILGHTIYFMFFGFFDDLRIVYSTLQRSFFFTVVVNADIGVDTFFFLSGLLVTYLTLGNLSQSNRRINWLLFYVHRFLRITPAYMISIAIWASLAIHFGQGPGKITWLEGVAGHCREQWWTYPLYINNLYPFPGDQNTSCFGWGWYLANDMQFFLISPIIIYLLHRKPKFGMALIVALCLASFGVTAYLATYYGESIGLQPAYNNRTLVEYGSASADVIYTKPYCRIPAYLVGIVFGYLIHRVNGKQFQMNKALNVFLWFASVTAGVVIVFGVYRKEINIGVIPQYAAVLYDVFHRPVFVLAVGWVAFSCTVGYGGPVNTLLSWGLWTPLSRVTFCAYLLHPIIITSVYTCSNVLYHFSYVEYVAEFLAQLVMAYAAAFVLSVGVEGPIMGLEKALLGRGARKK